MVEIYKYSLAILVGVGIFGLVLWLMRLSQAQRLRSAESVIRSLEKSAATDLERKDQAERAAAEEELFDARRRFLYGIPYLAWILTSLVIPIAFLILFFENIITPYSLPDVGTQSSITYRAPTSFHWMDRVVRRHEILITKNTPVSQADRRLVEEALHNRTHVPEGEAFGSLMILTIFIFILLYHISILYPSGTEKNKNLILIYLTVLIVLACAKISLFYEIFSAYLIPVPWAGMMITILINRRIVPLIMLITLIFVSLASQFDFGLFLVLLAGGLVSGSWVRQARKRSEVIAASVMVGCVMMLVFFCQSVLINGEFALELSEAMAALSNGIVSGLLTLTILPLFESIFDFASPFRLMEFLDLNTPILKDFFFKAPGTYQHSMVVANIAESVANEIGVNGLLTRVGSYYHDIGKMFNPQYFIENQAGGENPHEKLGPVASAAVVRSHVILGLQLARQIGLPGPVMDFITEHHGTSTIDYFYYKSKKLESEMKSERIFKYPGPKPRSKETAIVMLVDSVEAAFRVAEKRDEEGLRDLVNRIAQRKLEQEELDHSGLTIGELKKIVNVLTHVLKSTGHQRIPYPSDEELKEAQQSRLRVVSKEE